MFMAKILFVFLIFIASCTFVPAGLTDPARSASSVSDEVSGNRFYRTELYFGRGKPDGGTVSDDEWKDFLDREVTSRFPAGFTVLDGAGQYRDKSGKIVKESSKVLVFLYFKEDRKSSGTRINEIRAAYCKQFQQESVLRLDFRKAVEVSFDD